MNKKLTILPMLVALFGCSTVPSTDDIPVVKGFDAARPTATTGSSGSRRTTISRL